MHGTMSLKSIVFGCCLRVDWIDNNTRDCRDFSATLICQTLFSCSDSHAVTPADAVPSTEHRWLSVLICLLSLRITSYFVRQSVS